MPLKIVITAIFLAVYVAIRRLFLGRRRPTWTWRFETIVTFIRWLARRVVRYDIAELRDRLSRLPGPRSRVLGKVEFRPVAVDGIPSEWIIPKEDPTESVILYLHGGGYVLCSIDTHRVLISKIAMRARAKTLAINYRLAPEHPFPAALEDAVASYRWLLKQNIDPKNIVIAGDSAGGGLTLATLLFLNGAGDPLPGGAVLISPLVDMTNDADPSMKTNAPFDYIGGFDEIFHKNVEMYLAGADPENPQASPIYGDFHGLPPILVHVGGAEILLDQNKRLAERLREAGVPVVFEVWPDMVHVWHAFGSRIPESRRAIIRIGEFIRDLRLSRGAGV